MNALQRFDSQLAKHRDVVVDLLKEISDLAEDCLASEGQDSRTNDTLQRIDIATGNARSRMAQIRAWKESRALFAHLDEGVKP